MFLLVFLLLPELVEAEVQQEIFMAHNQAQILIWVQAVAVQVVADLRTIRACRENLRAILPMARRQASSMSHSTASLARAISASSVTPQAGQ